MWDFAIGLHLFLVRLAETDHSGRPLTQTKTNEIQPSALWDESQKSLLAVVTSLIAADAGLTPLQLSNELKRQSALFLVLGALFRVELDFHRKLL
jgi:hypothetical protein